LGWASYGPAQVAGLARLPFIKKSKNFSKIILKKFAIFSYIFLPIIHNIGLYIYTVIYKFGIKIPGFLQNISKKKTKKYISKHFQKEKNILLHTAKP
jgi:hypothetical protein